MKLSLSSLSCVCVFFFGGGGLWFCGLVTDDQGRGTGRCCRYTGADWQLWCCHLFPLCVHVVQGNHYQFDCIRRAKHSSAMILYHVNNPTAPAFIHTCDMCNTDIIKGNRWECAQCSEYDLCDTCKPKASHPHPLKAVAVRTGFHCTFVPLSALLPRMCSSAMRVCTLEASKPGLTCAVTLSSCVKSGHTHPSLALVVRLFIVRTLYCMVATNRSWAQQRTTTRMWRATMH
jgi:hypothetical protein